MAKQFTGRFLKNGYSQSDIYDALIYLRKQTEMNIYVYTFKNKTWTMIPFSPQKDCSTNYPQSRLLLSWLNENATKKIKEGFTFCSVPQEPIHDNSWLGEERQIKIRHLFDTCPVLATCTHPEILWTENAVLIPDYFILNENYYSNCNEIIKENNTSFVNRKPVIFFRGAITGAYSQIQYDMESIKKDDRLVLFGMSKEKEFIDAKITADYWLDNEGKATVDFLNWYKHNLTSRKSAPVDFIAHAQNKYLISIDGFGAAWSRVPYILFTGSVLLLRADCKQYFYKLLTPKKTHVEINRYLTNIEEVYTYLEQNPKVAESIANNGKAFAEKYLIKDAIDTYLTHVIYDLNEAYYEPTGWMNKTILAFKKIRFQIAEIKYASKRYFRKHLKPYFMRLKSITHNI
ncbi:MAG: glycosyl transferase family 90 [Pseudomonadota bacterium]